MDIAELNSEEESLVDQSEKLIQLRQMAMETTSSMISMLMKANGAHDVEPKKKKSKCKPQRDCVSFG